MPESAAYLAVIAGAPARTVPLTPGEFVAGRVPGAAIMLPNMEISRRHCRFSWNGEVCTVEDMGSIRGTMVNGQKISTPTNLNPGDKVEIGTVTIEFGLGEGDGAGAAPAAAVPEVTVTPILVRGKPTDRIPTQIELTIGRDPSADVVLSDPSVSRRHAMIRPAQKGGCVVKDLDSRAGSFVNGHRFDTHELTVGDRLQIGPFCFQYDGSALVRLDASRGSTVQAQGVFRRVGSKVLLNGVTFTIPPSHFSGILGPSGAGKSTLLNAMAGLSKPDGGMVLVDRENIYAGHEPPSFGYVPQDDIVHRELTVAQALRYAAKLRLPASTPEGEIERLLDQTMEQLGLMALSALPIHRLSGGQRKRVSVGVELLVRPAILFLDEPSSGLDPATEFQLMELLRDLADSGCTIICTTHVIENAYLMDELLVLMAGCLVYQGSAQDAREYFGVSKLVALYERLAEHTPLEWKSRFETKQETMPPEQAAPEPRAPRRAAAEKPKRRWALGILLQRQAQIFAADWRNFALVLGEPLVVALLVAWVASGHELALFFAYLGVLWFGCSNAAQEIVKEVPIYRRERLVGVGTHSYLLSKFAFQFAVTAVQGIVLYAALYLGKGHLDGSVLWQLTAILGVGLASVGIGTAISALSSSIMQAVLVVPLVLIPQILFSGFTVPVLDMSPSVYHVARLSPTFAAQTLVRVSIFWGQKIGGEYLDTYHDTFTNLNYYEPKEEKPANGKLYDKSGPYTYALINLFSWALVSYGVAWWALRRIESRR